QEQEHPGMDEGRHVPPGYEAGNGHARKFRTGSRGRKTGIMKARKKENTKQNPNTGPRHEASASLSCFRLFRAFVIPSQHPATSSTGNRMTARVDFSTTGDSKFLR